MKKALVCGAGGFIGSHLVRRLVKEGYWVKGIDLKYPEFIVGDLRDRNSDNRLIKKKLGWAPSQSLKVGITSTYQWVHDQVHK